MNKLKIKFSKIIVIQIDSYIYIPLDIEFTCCHGMICIIYHYLFGRNADNQSVTNDGKKSVDNLSQTDHIIKGKTSVIAPAL